jgi:GTP:adenosylcobinamide-phosphate guanylyltransferase
MPAALILAGADNTGPLKEESNAKNEALIEIHGKPMISYIIDVLRSVSQVSKITVVGPRNELLNLYPDLDVIDHQGSIMDNLGRGLEYLKEEEYLLILTADIPMITSDAINDFFERCDHQKGADFYYPINSKEVSENRFPGVKRTYIKTRDGTFTGGNVFLVNVKNVLERYMKAKEFIAMRKKPFRLAVILGLPFIVRFLTNTLTISVVERKVSTILGIKAVAVITPFAEIGVDVDKPEDLELAKNVLIT